MNSLTNFQHIKAFVFDVDGVLTDATVFTLENGDLLRIMNVRDGYAIKKALIAGFKMAIITGGTSEGVKIRLEKLGIENIYLGVKKKLPIFTAFLKENSLKPEEVLYMGDDMPDRHVMQYCPISACPKDAVPTIKEIANYISPFKGGQGCVRDIIEKVLRVQEKWES